MKEMWTEIEGYEGVYEVSNLGRVRRMARGNHTWPGRVLRAGPNSRGRPTVRLSWQGVAEYFAVSFLVSRAFLGPCPPGHEACHLNGDKADDRLENLAYLTKKDSRRNPRRPGNKLTAAKAAEIRKTGAPGPVLALRFGVTREAIRQVRARRTWSD
jgi:hypothetical protein